MAAALRVLAMDAVEQAQSGHPGMPMGMADVATVLFTRFLKYDAAAPDWPDRDRFVLSAGHGSMLLYALLHLSGNPAMTVDELRRFRQLGSLTPGHPEYGHTPGVETTTGPLGQGLATAVGMAIAERMLSARHGPGLVDHRTWVVAGDGCLMEGISHEAISLAGHLRLNKLCVLFDDNGITIDGSTALSCSDDMLRRFEASGWAACRIDGHDPEQIAAALSAAQTGGKPTLIACRTTIGYGAPTKAGTAGVHGAPLGADEIRAARRAFDWPHPPFEIPGAIAAAWQRAGARGAALRERWQQRLEQAPAEQRRAFAEALAGGIAPGVGDAVRTFKRAAREAGKPEATRVSSQKVLDLLGRAQPNLVGGSADLTHSNNTIAAGMRAVAPGDFSGRYLHYGIREHAMAAAMNGIALHGGFIPYGGTFLVFSDYCRPSMRLSALMNQRVIYVMTHDSIGLGEDGPTHQPVEHLASLRVIPNLQVMRPADAVETAECWQLALQSAQTPSVLCLSRQNLPILRTAHDDDNRCARGAYVLREAQGRRDATLLATGSEVALALDAALQLATQGIDAAVVSMPCWERFEQQPADYRKAVLGTAPRFGVEAALRQGWDRWLGDDGGFIGMTGFGASAPAKDLYPHFGLTVERITEIVRTAVQASSPARREEA
ncbi:transketolase [Sinimarinibacterium flocculans]